MKKIRNILLLLACCLAVSTSFTSCINDNDNNSDNGHYFTKAERAIALTAIEGNYQSNIKWYTDASNSKVDSMKTSFSIADSTLSMPFPVSILYKYVPSADSSAVKAASPVTFTATIHPYYSISTSNYNSYWLNGSYGYYFIPDKPLTFTANNNQYKIEFYTDTYMSFVYSVIYPICEYYNKKLNGYILIKSITVNGNSINANTPIGIIGNKSVYI